MRILPFLDRETREDVLDYISGAVFDRAVVAFSDEPMRLHSMAYARAARRSDASPRSPRHRALRGPGGQS